MRGRQGVAFLLNQTWVLTLLLKNPKGPWLRKVVAGCTAAYLVSLIQVIPTFIPVIGQLDDLFVLFVGMKIVRKLTPPEIMSECEALAASSVLLRRIEGTCELPTMDPSGIPAA
jgi:uncharacterized membrane protein YkvA (DUF1232 family)